MKKQYASQMFVTPGILWTECNVCEEGKQYFSQSTIAKTDNNEVSPVHLIFFLRIFQLWVLVKKEMTQSKSV
jgi:hypothetical protein